MYIPERMVDLSEFQSISPYTDAEAAEALSKLAEFPLLSAISQKVFPSEEPDYLKNTLKSINTIDEFQILVMQKFVRWVIETTAKNFSYDTRYTTTRSEEGRTFLTPESRYFVDLYSMCYPKEDRARLLEYAMAPGNESLFRPPMMQKKLQQFLRH